MMHQSVQLLYLLAVYGIGWSIWAAFADMPDEDWSN